MIRISFSQYPPENSAYMEGAFAESIGREIPFQMEGTVLQAVVTDVVTSDDGLSALITVQLPVTFPALLDGISVVSNKNTKEGS